MTVKELIERLEKIKDKEMEVKLEDSCNDNYTLKGIIKEGNYIKLTSWTKTY